MSVSQSEQAAALERQISALTTSLTKAKAGVQNWVDAGVALSRNAAEARAENQGSGRGIVGAFLGSKFRGAMRSAAAASNAEIAQKVAANRATIAQGKSVAQEEVRRINQQLQRAKEDLKALTVVARTKVQGKTAVAKSASASLDLLKKLKDAHEAGLLTDAEYQEKRAKQVADI